MEDGHGIVNVIAASDYPTFTRGTTDDFWTYVNSERFPARGHAPSLAHGGATDPLTLVAFILDNDGYIEQSTQYSTSNWSPFYAHPWHQSGAQEAMHQAGIRFTSQPAVGSRPDGGVELFATASNGHAYLSWRVPGNVWYDWIDVGGPSAGLKGKPATAPFGYGGLAVFVRGNDDALYWAHKSTQDDTWSGWYPLGGTLGEDPVTGMYSDGRIDVFAVEKYSRSLCHKWQTDNSWSQFGDWSCDLGGYLTAKPAVANAADGAIEIFARGSDGHLWQKYQTFDSNYWSDWQSHGGDLNANTTDEPIAAVLNKGRLNVFVTSYDNRLYQIYQNND